MTMAKVCALSMDHIYQNHRLGFSSGSQPGSGSSSGSGSSPAPAPALAPAWLQLRYTQDIDMAQGLTPGSGSLLR